MQSVALRSAEHRDTGRHQPVLQRQYVDYQLRVTAASLGDSGTLRPSGYAKCQRRYRRPVGGCVPKCAQSIFNCVGRSAL